MRFIFGCCLLIGFGSLNAASEVELDLKGAVDPELNIERIDGGGAIDIFSCGEARYRVVSNVDKDVEVVFRSRNNWVLKSSEANEIPYQGSFFSDEIETVIDSDKSSEIITKEKIKNKKYEFKLVFSAKESIEKYPAGNYSDKISISVVTK